MHTEGASVHNVLETLVGTYDTSLVTYGVLSGDKEPIESIGLLGAREMYNSLGVPLQGMAEAIKALKIASLDLLSREDAVKTAPYFHFMIQGML